jgi:iron complex transport system permease protein
VVRTRAARACLGLGVALAVAAGLRMLSGDGGVSVPTRADIASIRFDRTVAGASVGAALAVAGALLQAILRNPLASPFILGLTSGAGLGVVIWTYIGYATTGALLLTGPPVAPALVGAFAALGVVYALAQKRGAPEPTALILVGVIISVICAAVTTFVQHLMPDRGMAVYTRWVMGSISDDTGWRTLWAIAAVTVAGGAWATALGRELDAASMSDDEARSVGVSLGRLRAIAVQIGRASCRERV